MYDSVLVPLDGSTFAEQALPLALELCRRSGATLHVVLVHDAFAAVPQYGEPPVLDHSVDVASRRQEEEYLEAVARPLANAGVVVVSRLLEGPVAHSLTEYARVSGIELVVLTTHGRGVFSRFWIGSVADRLLRQLELPMLVLRPHASRGAPAASQLRRIMVPLDGSPLAEAVLGPALRLGELLGAQFTLYSAVVQTPPIQLPYPGIMVIPEQPAVTSMLERQAAEYLDGLAKTLTDRGLSVDTAVELTTDSVSAISTWAERHGADLIALATHGYGGATRLLLGSVADKLLRSATVPVLVWRPDAEAVRSAPEYSGERKATAAR
jgi:nucleotide-binding universal stress UspA family protein